MAAVSAPTYTGGLSNGTCDSEPVAAVLGGQGTMTHPSGAVGMFRFASLLHGRSHVYRQCQGNDGDGTGWAVFPRYFYSYSLTHKTLTGAGLPAAVLTNPDPGGTTWKYEYLNASAASWANCIGNCPETKEVVVTDPEQTQTRYVFGTRYQATEGQLLFKHEGASDGSAALRSTEYLYEGPSAGPYPSYIGYSVQPRTTGDLSTLHTPQKRRHITQQSITFMWQANRFDRLARPVDVTRKSTLGYTRRELTTYADIPNVGSNPSPENLAFTNAWVLGAVKTVHRLDADGTVKDEIESHAFDTVRLKPITNKSFGLQTQSFTYYDDGNLATRSDGLGHATTFSNYKLGIARDVSYADSASEHASVDDRGLITAVANAVSTTTGYQYDPGTWRLIKITPPADEGINYHETQLAFGPSVEDAGLPAGHWKQTVTTAAAVTVRHFDALWRPVLTTTYSSADPTNTSSAILKRFDFANRSVFQSYPLRSSQLNSVANSPQGTRTFYDRIGRVVRSEQDSELPGALSVLATTTNYPPQLFMRTVTNPRGYSSTSYFQAYDTPSEDMPTLMQLPANTSVSIGRDLNYGYPLSVTRGSQGTGGDSITRRYVYDGNQRLCKTIEPETGATVQQLDAAGNLLWHATGLNLPSTTSCDQGAVPPSKKVNFSYDIRNRLQWTTYGDYSPSIQRTYTSDGLLRSVRSDTPAGAITWSYIYNNRRLLTQETGSVPSGSWTFTHQIDPYGHEAAFGDPLGTVNYAPNPLGQPTQVSGYASNVTYHPNGAVTGYLLNNGVQHTTALNLRGLPSLIENTNQTKVGYTYDANGNVASITDHLFPAYSRTMPGGDAGYDGLDRLKQVNTTSSGQTRAQYTYDAVDNIRTSWVAGRSLTHGYDANNRLTSLSGTLNIGFTYDLLNNNGNITGRGSQAFQFDIGNRMSSAVGVADYHYDGHGRRTITKFAGGDINYQGYTLDGKLRLSSQVSSGNTRYVYLGGKLIAEDAVAGSPVYTYTDALGSPLAKQQGSAAPQRSQYEPYGKALADAGLVNPTKIGFTGHFNDADTGLVYMQQRYYEPLAGRFLSVDPVVTDRNTGASFGRYHYAGNNPYRFVDPDGQYSIDACTNNPGASCERYDAETNDSQRPFLGVWGGEKDREFWLYRDSQLDDEKCDEICEYKRDFVNPQIRAHKAGNDAAAAVSKVVEEGYYASAGGVAVKATITITGKGMAHVVERHTVNGIAKFSGKSKFNQGENLSALINSGAAQRVIQQSNGNFARTWDVGRLIGLDRATGQQTTIMTVITRPNGQLVTAFPGRP